MALWKILIEQSQPDASTKRGTITIKLKSDQSVLKTENRDFPIATGDSTVLDVTLRRSKEIATDLALAGVQPGFQYEIDSDVIVTTFLGF